MENCNKTVYRGQSAYEGCGGNSSSSLPGHGPEDLVKLLIEAQASFSNLQAVQEIVAANNIDVVDGISESAVAAVTETTEEEELENLRAQGQ